MTPPETRYAKSGDISIAYWGSACVVAMADPDETLVSSKGRNLIAGSGLRFADRGRHALRGLPEDVQLYRVLAD